MHRFHPFSLLRRHTTLQRRASIHRLPSVSLVGQIPLHTIGNLTDLRVLSPRFNRLSGQIPFNFSNLKSIRSIYLQDNEFSGNFPTSLWQSIYCLTFDDACIRQFFHQSPAKHVSNNCLNGSIPAIIFEKNDPQIHQLNKKNHFRITWNALGDGDAKRIALQKNHSKSPSLDEVKSAFDVFDENRDGFIDARELQRVISALDLKNESEIENCKRMIRVFDEKEDERIYFNEFVKFMESSLKKLSGVERECVRKMLMMMMNN